MSFTLSPLRASLRPTASSSIAAARSFQTTSLRRGTNPVTGGSAGSTVGEDKADVQAKNALVPVFMALGVTIVGCVLLSCSFPVDVLTALRRTATSATRLTYVYSSVHRREDLRFSEKATENPLTLHLFNMQNSSKIAKQEVHNAPHPGKQQTKNIVRCSFFPHALFFRSS
jgi:hypothetical protein